MYEQDKNDRLIELFATVYDETAMADIKLREQFLMERARESNGEICGQLQRLVDAALDNLFPDGSERDAVEWLQEYLAEFEVYEFLQYARERLAEGMTPDEITRRWPSYQGLLEANLARLQTEIRSWSKP